MIRVVSYLIAVGLLALGFAWLADRPGDVLITWQDRHIETSLMMMGVTILALLVVLILILILLRAILRSPRTLTRHLRHRRGLRAYEAISKGLIAIGAGDIGGARRFTAEVNRLAPSEPLALLLNAQSAQLAGDRDAAERAFRSMASRHDTKALGLHGLFIEAQRRDDGASARAYAEEAARTAPTLGWASRAVLEARCKDGDWAGALTLLERNAGILAKAIYRRQRAVLLTARALALEETDRDSARSFALEANKLAPSLVPAAALSARLLSERGEARKASRIIGKAWSANPHPELAQAFTEIRSGDSARDRLKRIETLAQKVPGEIEGALATARAALDAHEYGKTRAALQSYLAAPTKRVALLMAALERAEHNDEGRAREWLGRALHAAPDPAWTADGHVSDRWLPISPVSGHLDAFTWRVPLTGIVNAPVIEPESAPKPIPAPTAIIPVEAVTDMQRDNDHAMPASPEVAPSRRGDKDAEPKPEPVIPLVHAPDDPGPETAEDNAPAIQAQGGSGWRKIFE